MELELKTVCAYIDHNNGKTTYALVPNSYTAVEFTCNLSDEQYLQLQTAAAKCTFDLNIYNSLHGHKREAYIKESLLAVVSPIVGNTVTEPYEYAPVPLSDYMQVK